MTSEIAGVYDQRFKDFYSPHELSRAAFNKGRRFLNKTVFSWLLLAWFEGHNQGLNKLVSVFCHSSLERQERSRKTRDPNNDNNEVLFGWSGSIHPTEINTATSICSHCCLRAEYTLIVDQVRYLPYQRNTFSLFGDCLVHTINHTELDWMSEKLNPWSLLEMQARIVIFSLWGWTNNVAVSRLLRLSS